ncbi:MAG: dihydroorotate dehydrogenase [Spirochaetales bacterium]|nr:dihydroorotate dehydrogenase [Spirochaetales bacterium]
MDRLRTKFLGKEMSSPLVLPAGVLDISFSSYKSASENGAGLITTKSLTAESRTGHKGPVVTEVEGGMLNCMGLCNPGIEEGVLEIERFRKYSNAPVNVSIFATDEFAFAELAKKVNDTKADFLELNLSCPNVMDEFGVPLSASEKVVTGIISRVKSVSTLPVIAKLSPNVTSFTKIASAAAEAGADALCMINTLGPGIDIDIETGMPVLYNITGGLSGPALKPIALRLIYECRKAGLTLPIIGMGGIITGEDAVQMLMAGADLVGVGTGVYYRGPEIFGKINKEISDFLERKAIDSVGSVNRIV